MCEIYFQTFCHFIFYHATTTTTTTTKYFFRFLEKTEKSRKIYFFHDSRTLKKGRLPKRPNLKIDIIILKKTLLMLTFKNLNPILQTYVAPLQMHIKLDHWLFQAFFKAQIKAAVALGGNKKWLKPINKLKQLILLFNEVILKAICSLRISVFKKHFQKEKKFSC